MFRSQYRKLDVLFFLFFDRSASSTSTQTLFLVMTLEDSHRGDDVVKSARISSREGKRREKASRPRIPTEDEQIKLHCKGTNNSVSETQNQMMYHSIRNLSSFFRSDLVWICIILSLSLRWKNKYTEYDSSKNVVIISLSSRNNSEGCSSPKLVKWLERLSSER